MSMTDHLWSLYKSAFPPAERRTLEQQKRVLENPAYHFNPIQREKHEVGFLAWWDLGEFNYVEHFAVDSTMRGKGIGSVVIKTFLEEHDKPVLLEVDPPEDDIAKRRIALYERLGFVLSDISYQQPPYERDGLLIPLRIMTTDDAKRDVLKKRIKILKKIVYEK